MKYLEVIPPIAKIQTYHVSQRAHSECAFRCVEFHRRFLPETVLRGTPVLTAAGLAAIETVAVGDIVIATNPETGETAEKEVLHTFINGTNELVHLTVNGEEIVSTPGHKFYAPEKGWISAVDLRAGDILVLVNGEYVTVEAVQHEILEVPVTVYNFQVEDFHTYYVGEQCVLVHNQNNKSYCGIAGNSLENGVGVRVDNADDLAAYGTHLGKDGQLFLTSSEALADLDLANRNDLAIAEQRLGLPEGRLSQASTVVVTTINLEGNNPRQPQSGNEYFIPGGETSGGAPELVIDPINVFTDDSVESKDYLNTHN